MAKMDLISSPVLALKLSKEDFDPDQCKSQACAIGNKVVYIKFSVVKIRYIFIVGIVYTWKMQGPSYDVRITKQK